MNNRFSHIQSPSKKRATLVTYRQGDIEGVDDKRIAVGQEAYDLLMSLLSIPRVRPTDSHAALVEAATRRELNEAFQRDFKP